MPTSKPPRILLGNEVDAVEIGAAPADGTLGRDPSRDDQPTEILPTDVSTVAGDRSLAPVDLPDASGAAAMAGNPAAGLEMPESGETSDAGMALPKGAPALPGVPALGGALLMGEAGRLWGAFASRQMTRAMEGFAETARCRTPMDVLGLQQRLVHQTLQDYAAFSIDLATVPMRSMAAPTTVCRPVPSA